MGVRIQKEYIYNYNHFHPSFFLYFSPFPFHFFFSFLLDPSLDSFVGNSSIYKVNKAVSAVDRKMLSVFKIDSENKIM